ncbi:MAG TPA: spore germination protein [Clostridiales bacterium]|nr:spore germination protein [Clostridiales bacterium]
MLKHFWTRKKQTAQSEEYLVNEFEDNYKEITTANVKIILADSSDIVYQEHYINGNRNLPVTVVFVDGMVDIKLASDNILKPLTQEKGLGEVKGFDDIIELIEHGIVYHASRKIRTNLGDVLNDIISGSVALIFDKEKRAITFDAKGYEKRGVTEPTSENAVKGPKDAFVEVLRVNTSLVRRRISTPYLRIKETTVGRQSLTQVAVVYIENLTNENIIKEVMKRLNSINEDAAISPGLIEEYIIDKKSSPFPQVLNTERVDKFCANIIEGRVGIIIDGMPVAYIAPASVTLFFQAPEDYAYHFIISSAIRLLRYISALIALLLPAFYVSVTTFHQEMIPTVLAISIIRSESEVPFPTVTSIIGMLIAFEMLLEAGIRLPRAIGQAVSIIGALVVGQAAAQAKLISPVVVIIIAVTGIAGFIIPSQDLNNGIRILRMIFVLFASIAGLYGLSLGFIMLIYHLSTIETFGVPYLTPFAPSDDLQFADDTLIRMPLAIMRKRPESLKTINKKRR